MVTTPAPSGTGDFLTRSCQIALSHTRQDRQEVEVKTCSRCLQDLPVESFHQKGGGYRRPECKDCFKALRPRKGAAHCASLGISYTANKAAYQRFYKYGITPDEYDALLASQAGKCAICESTDHAATDWQVDHDHVTGAIRGLLCRPCNVALGLMRDDVDRMRRAIDYLGARSNG